MGVAGGAGNIAGPAMVGIGAAQAAYQGFRGSQESSLLERNASITEANAPYVRAAAREKARQYQVASYLMQGRQQTGYAASGLAVGGSVFDVMADTARNYTRDASFALLEGELQARGMQQQAEYFRIQARNTMRDALVGGALNFGSTAIMANTIKTQYGGGGGGGYGGGSVLGVPGAWYGRINTGVTGYSPAPIGDPFRP